MYFRNYGLRKTWLDKCLKRHVSEDLLIGNLVNGPKHCFDLNDSTFTILIDHYEGHLDGKVPSWWQAKSRDCLLTHWLAMTGILFLVETIWCNQFRCCYLKNRNIFLISWCIFQIFIKFWKFSNKENPHSLCISEITDSERHD